MGCTRSAFEPLICQSDEKEFLHHQISHCENGIITSQSSSDYSVFKIGTNSNSNNAAVCPFSGWVNEIPEILTGVIHATKKGVYLISHDA